MHSFIVSILIMINISLLVAMPPPFIYSGDQLQDYNDIETHPLIKRFQLSSWLHKRNPALCDYRLQLRPLPLTSALCAFGLYK
jgi:hypothetical protein